MRRTVLLLLAVHGSALRPDTTALVPSTWTRTTRVTMNNDNYCTSCGTAVGDWKFCGNCGTRVKPVDEWQQPNVPNPYGQSNDYAPPGAYQSPEAYYEATQQRRFELQGTDKLDDAYGRAPPPVGRPSDVFGWPPASVPDGYSQGGALSGPRLGLGGSSLLSSLLQAPLFSGFEMMCA